MQNCTIFFLLALTFYISYIILSYYYSDAHTDWLEAGQDDIDIQSVNIQGNKSEIFESWNSCFTVEMMGIEDPEIFWKTFVVSSKKCDYQAGVRQLGIVTLKHKNKTKRVLFPKVFNTGPHNLFTIGVGRDIRAEKQFRRKMHKLGNNVTFVGADPVPHNGDLYSQIGNYFPLAIGGKSGISNARVLENSGYIDTDKIHIDVVYFFKDLLNVTNIDNLWFDAEGEEFANDFFDIFYENGKFVQSGIDLCQVNIEIHITSDVAHRKEEFMKFLKRIIQEKRFGVFFGDAFGHIRMYMFNYSSQYCLDKF
ncbi:Methyltransferase FkbM domain-containing protein [Caenorhabditis elegans]|uniref:Methyltransferase FkbM domain-containing protein n=1 Tax=Caenorhabditis elegans TaxID=6239 RepID=O01453_CAEEL|nr:Methyltransferase FkbM domain-containing protein [Caenorhabditis elegans]CCD62692.1 Methyltransferase FkbM domain-containing protein [Caenorhabditis elegans]|eukprot:NP_504878.2 Uncharacterized protein CELE_C03G6.6 [Caenorhabditis elegans]